MKVFLLGIFLVLLLGIIGFVMSVKKTPKEQNNQPEQKETTMIPSELQIEDSVVGEGKEATTGKLVEVHYTGTLLDVTKFDSSLDRGTPFQFVLGAGNVIKGWDQGVLGMKVGGKRKLTIPPELGYGAAGVPGTIPPKATLVFEIELLDVLEQ